MILTRKKERKIIKSPMTAYVSVFLASATACWSPFDVMNLNPEKMMRIRAATPARTSAALMRFFMMMGIQRSVATPASRQLFQSIRNNYAVGKVGSFRSKRLRPKSPSTKLRMKKARKTMMSPTTAAII